MIGYVADELLTVNWSTLTVNVTLSMNSSIINKHVRISDNARNRDQDVIIHFVKLSTFTSWDKEGRNLFLFRGEYNTCTGKEQVNNLG